MLLENIVGRKLLLILCIIQWSYIIEILLKFLFTTVTELLLILLNLMFAVGFVIYC